MCLSNFFKFRQIEESNPIIGYRSWRIGIKNPKLLKSLYQNYDWKLGERHEVLEKNSGIYSYNYYNYKNNNYNYYNYNNNNYNYYNYNNYNYDNNNYYYYHNYNNYLIQGIIKQFGAVAVHKDGYRSEYATIDTLFSIREQDAKGPKEFLTWIKEFNNIIEDLTKKYNCKMMHYQDFLELENKA